MTALFADMKIDRKGTPDLPDTYQWRHRIARFRPKEVPRGPARQHQTTDRLAVHRDHPVARRHERFARLPLPRLQPADQDGRAAPGSREPGGAVHQRGESGGPLRAGAIPAHDAEPADPHDTPRMEVRFPVALQGRDLLL